MNLMRQIFERHSNPWSAWSRLMSTPLGEQKWIESRSTDRHA